MPFLTSNHWNFTTTAVTKAFRVGGVPTQPPVLFIIPALKLVASFLQTNWLFEKMTAFVWNDGLFDIQILRDPFRLKVAHKHWLIQCECDLKKKKKKLHSYLFHFGFLFDCSLLRGMIYPRWELPASPMTKNVPLSVDRMVVSGRFLLLQSRARC